MRKPFPEPDGNQPTPGPDDNLALAMNQLMVASVMIVPYILPQIVLKKILKVIIKVVIHLKKETIHCFWKPAAFIPFTFYPQCGNIITTKRKNTQGNMLIVKRVLAEMQWMVTPMCGNHNQTLMRQQYCCQFELQQF